MRFTARRSLAMLSALAAMALVSCTAVTVPEAGPEPKVVSSKLAPDNHVFDLEAEGLKLLWAQELGQLSENRSLKDIYSAGDFVVIEAQDGEVHCLDAETGVWKATKVLRDELRLPPTAIGDMLVFVVKNNLVVYDTATDEVRRPCPTSFALTARPLLYGDALFLAGGDGNVARLPLAGREIEWLAALTGAIFEQPVVAGGRLLVSAPSGVLIWDLAEGLEFSRWAPNAPARLTSGVAAVGGRIYVGDNRGFLHSLQANTGQHTWQRMLGAPVVGRLTVAGSKLLVLTGKPSLICMDAASEREQYWQQEGVVEVLTVGQAAVYVLNADGSVAAISLETGKEAWREPLPADCKLAGDANRPTIYIANPRGSVVALAELD